MLLCPACGYDLRGIESDRCPECGTAIDRAQLSHSHIPWPYRKQLGRFRTYWGTVLLTMFRPHKLAAEMARPVSFDDARRFSRRTAVVAWAPLALLLLYAWLASMKLPIVPFPPTSAREKWRWIGGNLFYRSSGQVSQLEGLLQYEVGNPLSLGFALEVLVFAIALASTLLGILLICRAGGYFFHPPDQSIARQNRAVALSHYACAPLSLLGLAMPFIAYARWSAMLTRVFGRSPPGAMTWPTVVAFVLPLVVFACCWLSHLMLLRKTTGCSTARVVAMAILLPAMWLIIAAVAVSLPAAALLLSLMFLSIL